MRNASSVRWSAACALGFLLLSGPARAQDEDTEPDAVAEVDADPDAAPESDAAPEPDAAPESDAAPEPDAAAEPDAEPDAAAEPDTATEPDAMAEPMAAEEPLDEGPSSEELEMHAMPGESDNDEGDFDEPNTCTGPFCQGSLGLSIGVGSASGLDGNYLVLGAGVSYFIINGLALGLDGDVWLLEEPHIYTLTPQVEYVLYFVPVVQPYVGAFYRHYFLADGFDDLNSVGARAGVYLGAGSGSYLGLGALYEKFVGCDSSVFSDCDSLYPELSIAISF